MRNDNFQLACSILIGETVIHKNPQYGSGIITDVRLLKGIMSNRLMMDVDFRTVRKTNFDILICLQDKIFTFKNSEKYNISTIQKLTSISAEEYDFYSTLFPQSANINNGRKVSSESDGRYYDGRKNAELSNLDKEIQMEIFNYLKGRKVRYFVHFTPINNLDSIIKRGLLPRLLLDGNNIDYIVTDQLRWDNRLDCSSLSISFPNYQMFFNKRLNTPYHYVVLCFSIDVLKELPLGAVAYLPDNAASNTLGLSSSYFNRYTGIGAVENLFKEEIVLEGKRTTRTELCLKEQYTSNPQAEAFIQGEVPSKYLKYIYVDEAENEKMAQVTDILKNNNRTDISVKMDRIPFSVRSDYKFWSGV